MKFSYSAQARVNRVVGYLLATACYALFAAFILCFYHGDRQRRGELRALCHQLSPV